jgi:hypothetical protein
VVHGYGSKRRTASTAFNPPKANEFESAKDGLADSFCNSM